MQMLGAESESGQVGRRDGERIANHKRKSSKALRQYAQNHYKINRRSEPIIEYAISVTDITNVYHYLLACTGFLARDLGRYLYRWLF